MSTDDDGGGGEPSKAELKERIEQLEQTVRAMMPSRRDVLKGTGMAALGAAGMYSVTGGAQAQTQAAGQVGTESNPVDVEGATVSAGTGRFPDGDVEYEIVGVEGNNNNTSTLKLTRADNRENKLVVTIQQDNLGDAVSDDVTLRLYGDGTIEDEASGGDGSRLGIEWNNSSDSYQIEPQTYGSGTARALELLSENNANQLLVQPNGDVDFEAGDVNITAGDLPPRRVGVGYLYPSAFDGADVDARLANALNEVGEGEVVMLERSSHDNSITISDSITLRGTRAADFGSGTTFFASGDAITLSVSSIRLETLRVLNGIAVNGSDCVLHGIMDASITVSDDDALIYGCKNVDVTFDSGTSGGVVAASTNTSVTDNGTNTDNT